MAEETIDYQNGFINVLWYITKSSVIYHRWLGLSSKTIMTQTTRLDFLQIKFGWWNGLSESSRIALAEFNRESPALSK